MAQGYTLEQLQKMGAKPVQTGQGFTLEQLKQMQSGQTGGPTQGGFMSSVGGFVGGLAKDIASPFARVGVTGYNALLGKEGQARNLPGLGQVQPLPSVIKPGGLISPEGKLQQPISLGGLGQAVGAGVGIGTTIGAPGEYKLAEKGITKAAETIGEMSAKRTTEKVIEMVSPKLNVAEKAGSIASKGTVKSGVFGKIKTVVDPYTKQIAETVQKYVPGFNPSKTLSENLNITKSAVSTLASDLKQRVIASGKDIIYPFKELASKMNAVEEPISLKGTPFEKQIGPIKEAAIKIAKDSGGKISNLFDARKTFDQLVEKTYPNLYDKEYSPIRTAITSIRNVMNDFIAEQLPDVAYKDSLTNQSHLFRAIDNMAEKIASGEFKELGTTGLERFGTRHPLITKGAKAAGVGAAGAIGAGTIYEGGKTLLGQ